MTGTREQAAAVPPILLAARRLPGISRQWKRLTGAAGRGGWPTARLPAPPLGTGMAGRASRRIQRQRGQSGLPAGKTFATSGFDAAPGVRKPHLLSPAAGGD